MYKFKPCKKRPNFRTVQHEVRIQLTGATEITQQENQDLAFPKYYFDFIPLCTLGVTIKENKTIVDVIGKVTWIGQLKHIQVSSGPMTIREIEIQDERDDKILVSIWEDCLPQVNMRKIEHESATQHVVLAFSSLMLINFSRKWSLRTYSATRIYQDPLPEMLAFQQRMTGKKIEPVLIENAQQETQSDASAPMIVSIAKLKEICSAGNQEKLFNVVAEIDEVLDEYDWYYNACPTHKTRIKSAKPHYTCPHCPTKIIERPEPWFNFILLVKDATGKAKFVFIGRQAELLLNCSAKDLLAQQTAGKGPYLPPKFKDLQKKKLLFTVHWGSKFKTNTINFQVTKTAPVPPTFSSEQSLSPKEKTVPIEPTTPSEYINEQLSSTTKAPYGNFHNKHKEATIPGKSIKKAANKQ